MRGLAVSVAQSDPWHWQTAADYAILGCRVDALAHDAAQFVLNINVPGLPRRRSIKGVRWADLDEFGYFRVATADVDDRRLQFVVGSRENVSDPASDTVLCEEGNVTITPLATVGPAPFPDIAAEEVVNRGMVSV